MIPGSSLTEMVNKSPSSIVLEQKKTRTMMQNPRTAMEDFSDAMSRELGRDDVLLAQKDLMYGISDILEWHPGAANGNGAFEDVVCHFY